MDQPDNSQPICTQKKPYKLEMEAGTYFWCACGRSQNQPFCDGSHAGTIFSPVKFEVPEKRMVSWCGCRQSQKGCLCDGTHKSLS